MPSFEAILICAPHTEIALPKFSSIQGCHHIPNHHILAPPLVPPLSTTFFMTVSPREAMYSPTYATARGSLPLDGPGT